MMYIKQCHPSKQRCSSNPFLLSLFLAVPGWCLVMDRQSKVPPSLCPCDNIDMCKSFIKHLHCLIEQLQPPRNSRKRYYQDHSDLMERQDQISTRLTDCQREKKIMAFHITRIKTLTDVYHLITLIIIMQDINAPISKVYPLREATHAAAIRSWRLLSSTSGTLAGRCSTPSSASKRRTRTTYEASVQSNNRKTRR